MKNILHNFIIFTVALLLFTQTAHAKVIDSTRGYILLQVESRGEAWYVNPVDEKRYYMRDGSAAYSMMRSFGLGITTADLEKIPVGIEDRFQALDSDGDGLFDKLEEGEIRPAMIPYFSDPDEISKPHAAILPHVGEYFFNQQQIMKGMFNEAKKIVSMGYSFSEGDKHVRGMIEKNVENRHEKKLFCILKGDDNEDKIKKLFNFKGKSPNFEYCREGITEESIKKIVDFFEKQ